MRYLFLSAVVILGLTGCVSNNQDALPEEAYGTPAERFLENVRIKHADEYGITYEYKDARIDEIAYMASEYCYEQNRKKAWLHDSRLYKNFARRATFDCR